MQTRFVRFVGSIRALPAPPLDALLDTADDFRRFGLTTLGRSFAQRVLTSRETRTAFFGCLLITIAFFSTSMFPVVMLVLGPIIWGIPHVLADLRYLVARPGLHHRPLVLTAIAIGVLGAGLGFGVRGGLAGAALALCIARTSWMRRVGGLAIVAGLFTLAQHEPYLADLAFAHLHNFIGVLIWWAWRPRQTRLHLLPLGLFALGTVTILLGGSVPLAAFTKGLEAPWTGMSMFHLCQSLTPNPLDPNSVRLVVLYAFAQATHYVVWLRLVPEDDRPMKSPRSYGQSFRALTKDLGGILLWISVFGALALIGWAVFAPGEARDGYLRLAFFHGHLELAAGALLWAEGRLGIEHAGRTFRS
ncbi:MAG TPA: hypothetical protein PK156_29665 [Polyangium sp.]|nr:hypothetical protein [Polyangium sp.]